MNEIEGKAGGEDANSRCKYLPQQARNAQHSTDDFKDFFAAFLAASKEMHSIPLTISKGH